MPPGVTGYAGATTMPPAPPPPPTCVPPEPPPATTKTCTDDTPLGTEKVPEDVNVCTTGAFFVIENALSLVFEAASLALIVNVEVVFEPTALGVPDIT